MSAVQTFNHNSTSSIAGFKAYQTSAIPTNTENYIFIENGKTNDIEIEDVGKYSIFDVANWFLLKESMTQKKLQKLCYYAQAWCFALRGYRLEKTEFEAWIHGPVSPVLWERFKSFGYDPICIKGVVTPSIDNEDIRLLEDVWDTYGGETGNALEALTHREFPWIEARKGYGAEERCSVVISPQAMASYYKAIYSGD